ncbi:MAG: hypothetical protein AAB364_00750 [Patescibacteria group bacterium]
MDQTISYVLFKIFLRRGNETEILSRAVGPFWSKDQSARWQVEAKEIIRTPRLLQEGVVGAGCGELSPASEFVAIDPEEYSPSVLIGGMLRQYFRHAQIPRLVDQN